MVYICGKDYGIHLQMENKEDKLMLQRLINLKV